MDNTRPQSTVSQPPRRVASAPVDSNPALKDGSASPSPVETLYVHPNVKIVAFTAPDTPQAEISAPTRREAGTLTPSSRFERTIAVGTFHIYRAPGSVAFLSCGSALQPILPKSKCWCIDESNTKYVLQIRRPNYWRIELPRSAEEDEVDSSGLRDVLDIVLQFEKTACPFQRAFTVELPEEPSTPVKKKPWTPKRAFQSVESPESNYQPGPEAFRPLATTRRASDANVMVSHAKFTNPDGVIPSNTGSRRASSPWSMLMEETFPAVQSQECSSRRTSSSLASAATDTTVSATASPVSVAAAVHDINRRVSLSVKEDQQNHTARHCIPTCDSPGGQKQNHLPGTRLASSENVRRTLFGSSQHASTHSLESGTVQSPSCSTGSNSIMKVGVLPHLDMDKTAAELTPSHSQDSFHSAESWSVAGTPLLPSTPTGSTDFSDHASSHELIVESKYKDASSMAAISTSISVPQIDDGLVVPRFRGTSSRQCRPGVRESEDLDPSSAPSNLDTTTITTHHDHDTLETRPSVQPVLKGGRAPSPSPKTSVLSQISTSRAIQPSVSSLLKRLPMVIVSKTCEVLLAPPTYLISLMLKVAARIVAGQWRGQVDGYTDEGERIPVHWDCSEGELSD